MTPNEETAKWLVAERFSPSELSEALEVSGQTARGYIRRFRDTRSPSRQKSSSTGRDALTWTDLWSLTQLWQFGTQNHSGEENEITHR